MSEKKADKPYMPFYIGDWKKAPEIRALRLDYRMVWFETLLVMWQGDEKGYLTINSVPFVITDVITGDITDGQDVLSSMLGISVDFLQESFRMFKKLNVYSVRSDGAIYSRFMVNMLKVKEVKSNSGRLGMEKRYKKSVITPVITNSDIEYIDIIDSETEFSEATKKDYKMVVVNMYTTWQKANPMYPKDIEKDYHALLQFAYKIAEVKGWKRYDVLSKKEHEVLKSWGKICDFIMSDNWLRTKPLSTCLNQWQRIYQEMLAANGQTSLEAKRIKPEEYFTES